MWIYPRGLYFVKWFWKVSQKEIRKNVRRQKKMFNFLEIFLKIIEYPKYFFLEEVLEYNRNWLICSNGFPDLVGE